MARSSAEVSQAIRAQLQILDPDISTEPLTPERKIIDTVSDVVAGGEVDSFSLDYQYNVDTKSGSDLDKFIALFGFARQGGRESTGTITFVRSTQATNDIVIPAGTQVIKPATSISPAVIFNTITTVTLYTGALSTDAPIECTSVGVFGNIPANTIVSLSALGTVNVSSVTNANATTGGEDIESDAELRVRFKNTIFRNIAGTTDQYLALALSSQFTNKANVLGPKSRFVEYLQTISTTTTGTQTLPVATLNVATLPAGFPAAGTVYVGGQAVTYTGKTTTTLTGASGGTGSIAAGTIVSVPTTSQIPYSKYTYNFDYFLTDGNVGNEHFYAKGGVDYTFANTVPPTFYVNNGTNIPHGSIVLLEQAYASVNSRNDPTNNIFNYTDVYISGTDADSVTEATVFPSATLNNTSSDINYRQNYRRANDNSVPTNGNFIQTLLWQPVLDIPSQIVIGVNTYTLNTDYWLIIDQTITRGSIRGRNAIEWASANTTPAGTAFILTYDYNKLPLSLNALMNDHKQVTASVLVHQATQRYFIVYLTIMYSPGYSSSAVDTAISTALTDFFQKQPFGIVIQFSDLTEVIHEVTGVDNVRITTSTDNPTTYGVVEVAADGITVISTHTTDFALQDADLPILNGVVTLRKSQNTWG